MSTRPHQAPFDRPLFEPEPVSACWGCGLVPLAACAPYVVTYHAGESPVPAETVVYCVSCADLAAIDWPGTIAAIRPAEVTP